MSIIKPSEDKKVREFENFHIVLWLMKDVCWVMQAKTLGTIMVFPTVSLAIYIAWLTRKSLVDLYHNLAVVCWISANSIWMLGELNFDETPQQIYYEYSRMIALSLFCLGIGFIIWYHLQKMLKKNA
ncbi:MAG: hypothetical protein H6600_08910 [Flavobacteriales bacterium]|nr:hypothetical protein [Flavobacteriales bacterium]MCB9198567.1 hypothetical protein [Flavobacteriales bacterium]